MKAAPALPAPATPNPAEAAISVIESLNLAPNVSAVITALLKSAYGPPCSVPATPPSALAD